MRTGLGSWLLVGVMLAAAGCGDDDGASGDAGGVGDGGGSDAGGGMDAGRRDSGPRPDAGTDPCAEDDDPASTAGCNGGIRGPQADNTFGGACDFADFEAGSCADEGAICARFADTGRGVCIIPCEPSSDSYVSTGDPPCPMGSRCFDLEDGAFCFPDCEGPKDCSVGECDGEASCIGGGPDPMPDGGVTDGGGGSDGSVVLPDADVSLPDASVDLDAGLPS